MENTRTAIASSDSGFSATIIVPAHNEATVIGRLLASLPREINGRAIQIIVSCNGCSDNTAQVASSYGVVVCETAIPSKIAALNAADLAAVAFPRLYIDADIEITPKAVRDIAEYLSTPGATFAAPPSRIELSGRPWLVRAYFRYWSRLMGLRAVHIGAGVYALSAKGRARFRSFPDVIADDLFVQNAFSKAERRVVQTDATVVQAPHTARALFRRRVRVCIGNMQLTSASHRGPEKAVEHGRLPWWRVILVHPQLLPDSMVYITFNILARIAAGLHQLGKAPVHWGRDDTTRPSSG
jgi:glycosyltransferase involved in cell wall biosynthesis